MAKKSKEALPVDRVTIHLPTNMHTAMKDLVAQINLECGTKMLFSDFVMAALEVYVEHLTQCKTTVELEAIIQRAKEREIVDLPLPVLGETGFDPDIPIISAPIETSTHENLPEVDYQVVP